MKLNPVSMVAAGPMLWPLDRAADVLSWYREFILDAPEDLNGFFAFLTVPPAPPFPEELHMQKMCGVVWCWTGDLDGADDALAEARAQPGIALDGVQPMPFPMLNSAFDGLYPAGDQWYWRADFVEEIPDEAVARHVEFGREAADLEVDHAPLSDQRRGAPRRRDRHAVGVPRRQLGHGHGRRRSRSGERRRAARRGASTTARRCIRTRRAAPT